MHTIEIDDETYASLEALAQQEHSSVSSVVKRALNRVPRVESPAVSMRTAHGYKIPISKGIPFTMDDVYAAEDENDMRGFS